MINNITEDYCSFEISKLLCEKGFNVGSRKVYDIRHIMEDWDIDDGLYKNSEDNASFYIEAPTHALVIKWIYINTNFYIWVYPDYALSAKIRWVFSIVKLSKKIIGRKKTIGYKNLDKRYSKGTKMGPKDFIFNSPEESTEAALLYCLTNLIK